jgi:succinyl-diaminopimelate desuccinylase
MTIDAAANGAIAGLPALQEPALADVLSRLVAVPSVNPGNSEEPMARCIEALLADTGCELTFVESMPGRPSLAAVLPGKARKPRLVLNGHMDTVAVDSGEQWSVDPFSGSIVDGSVWGRGAVDMKGGLAAQIACVRALSALPPLRGSLVLHFAAGEECGEPGTLSLIKEGFVGEWGSTTEPTNLAVAVAQRGVAWYRVQIIGRSGHGSAPSAARNPIDQLPSVLEALARYDTELGTRSEHLLLPPASCTPTMIRSGVQHNAIADDAEVIVDRRLLPGESPEATLEELRRLVAQAAEHNGFRTAVELHQNPFAPAEIGGDSPFVGLVMRTVEEVTGAEASIVGTAYGSDVRNLVNDAGMEAITFGAGDVRNCHCPDEHLPISELRQAAVVLAKVAVELLS